MTIGKSIEEHPKQFAVGALSSMGENMSLGMWQAPRPDNPSSAYYAGRAVGDVGGAIVGALPIAAGGALVGGGDTVLVLGAGTGVAIPAGLGVAALGTGAVTYGTGVETKSSNGLVNDTNRMLAEVSGESGTKGTGNPYGTYEDAPYHGKVSNSVKNKAPIDGQAALNDSVSIGPNTTRRVGVSDGEIVVLDETSPGVYHGHVRSWSELTPQMQSALRKAGLVDKKGRIIGQ